EICERKLGDPKRALAVLRDALHGDPEGRTLLGEIERLADLAEDPLALLDVYARVGRARFAMNEKIELLSLRARVKEERLGDGSGAMDEYLLAFSMDPDNEPAWTELERLAARTSRWEDLLRTMAERFARARSPEAKSDIACRAAALTEDKLGDPVRAF